LVSVRAKIWGGGCALSRACRYMIVVYMSLVMRVMLVMSGCMKSCGGVRSVSAVGLQGGGEWCEVGADVDGVLWSFWGVGQALGRCVCREVRV